MKPEKEHLPFMGVGPVYVGGILTLTAVAIFLSRAEKIPVAGAGALQRPLWTLGLLLILGGAWMWFAAFFKSDIDKSIEANRLVTDGVYAHVRNPIYSAFLFLCTGALLMEANLWLLVLPVIYWLFLTLLMKFSEEKWLLALYGQPYADYCRRVPRCIPRI